jgi:hypothetical protein
METEKRFLNLKEFRNAIKHGRGEIVPFLRKEGEAALEWLSIILEKTVKSTDHKVVSSEKSGGEIHPWVTDGKTWHLEKRCSPKTAEMLLKIDDIIRNNFEVEGPRWSQKFYVTYRIDNFNWLSIKTYANSLTLNFFVKAGAFNQLSLAKHLGVEEFNKESSLSEKWALPSYIFIKNLNETTDRVKIRIKEDFDLNSETFLGFLKDAYEAFPK